MEGRASGQGQTHRRDQPGKDVSRTQRAGEAEGKLWPVLGATGDATNDRKTVTPSQSFWSVRGAGGQNTGVNRTEVVGE